MRIGACRTVLFYPLVRSRTHGANTQLQRIFLKLTQIFGKCTKSILAVDEMKYEVINDTLAGYKSQYIYENTSSLYSNSQPILSVR